MTDTDKIGNNLSNCPDGARKPPADSSDDYNHVQEATYEIKQAHVFFFACGIVQSA